MSKQHGDRARFDKQRQGKILRGKRLRELTKELRLKRDTKTTLAMSE